MVGAREAGRSARGPASRWGVGVAAGALAAMCTVLGLWQWERAHVQTEIDDGPVQPLASVLAPAESADGAIGRSVRVSGEFVTDGPGPDAALVFGREVSGESAVLLVRPMRVAADATGTGEPATLAVLVGWRPASEPLVGPDRDVADTEVTGYLRSSEASALPAPDVPDSEVPRVHLTTAVSAAELAQRWPAPMYSAVLVAHDGSSLWEPMPQRVAATELRLQSAAYALEWWLFGVLALVVGWRWMRDNGRISPAPERSRP